MLNASSDSYRFYCNDFYSDTADELEYISYPMLFSADKPLEEFFCCCIQLLNRTWKEMRASKDDFEKVCTAYDLSQLGRFYTYIKSHLY